MELAKNARYLYPLNIFNFTFNFIAKQEGTRSRQSKPM
jgi:hypothetical protein